VRKSRRPIVCAQVHERLVTLLVLESEYM